jgi:hypothetical protein
MHAALGQVTQVRAADQGQMLNRRFATVEAPVQRLKFSRGVFDRSGFHLHNYSTDGIL